MVARRMVVFGIGDQRWAIAMGYLREISVGNRLYQVPLSPRCVAGLINLRGQTVTLIDVAACLMPSRESAAEAATCFVLKTRDERAARGQDQLSPALIGSDLVGLLVEEELGMIDVGSSDIRGVPAQVDSVLAAYIDGIVYHGDELVFLLNPGALLETACRSQRGNR